MPARVPAQCLCVICVFARCASLTRLLITAQIRADIEVTCFGYEGINAIKGALLKGVEMGSDDLSVKIKLVAPPLYVMLCSALDKNKVQTHVARSTSTRRCRRVGTSPHPHTHLAFSPPRECVLPGR